MDKFDNFKDYIEKQKQKGTRRPKYGMKKLSVGVVSCLIGFLTIMQGASGIVLAADSTPTEASEPQNGSTATSDVYENGIATIRTLRQLTEDERTSFTNQIQKWQKRKLPGDPGRTTTLVEKAKAIQEVRLLANLTKTEKEYFVKELKKVNSVNAFNTLLEEAKKFNTLYATNRGKNQDDAIESGTDTSDNHKIAGTVRLTYGGGIRPEDRGERYNKPLEGVTVYAQWITNKGIMSPVYKTTTKADGTFNIKMEEFISSDGKKNTFWANPNVGGADRNQKFRIWSVNPDEDKYELLYSYGFEKITPESTVFNTEAGATNDIAPGIMYGIEIRYAEKTSDVWKENAKEVDSNVTDGLGQVRGKVFVNKSVNFGGLQWNNIISTGDKGDIGIADVDVYASYLSDYALSKINSAEAKQEFVAEGSSWKATDKVRGSAISTYGAGDWTRENEKKLQDYILRMIEEEGRDKWIAETVKTKTRADGTFTAQFNGTFGVSYDNPGFDGAIASRDTVLRSDKEVTGKDADGNEVTRKGSDWFNTVAASADYGVFGGTGVDSGTDLNKAGKHINSQWVMVSAEMPGISFTQPFYGNVPRGLTGINNTFGNSGSDLTGNAWGVEPASENANELQNVRFAAFNNDLKFDITNYDSMGNYASIGDTAITKTTGAMPYGDSKYQIVWKDEDGNIVKESEILTPNTDGTLPEVNFEVPNIEKTTTYYAELYDTDNGQRFGTPIQKDSFTAVYEAIPTYEDVDANVGEKVSSGLPTFDLAHTDAVEKNPTPKGAKFALVKDDEGNVPTGFSIDANTGVVTWANVEGEPGTSQSIEVEVTYADGSTASTYVVFTVHGNSEDFEPNYAPVDGTVGNPVEVSPTFKDKDGNDAQAPTDGDKKTTFKTADELDIPEAVKKPEGATVIDPTKVTVDPDTGKVSVSGEGLPAEGTYVTPVEVTYPDGSKDYTYVTVNVKTPADKLDATTTPATVTEKKEVPANTKVVTPNKEGSTITSETKNGLSVDNNGNLVGTPEITDWNNTEEEREVTIPVTVKNGDETKTVDVKVTVQRDTDGDGTPDVTDTDDDGDGYSDEQEKNNQPPTDPKDSDSKPETAPELSVETKTAKVTEKKEVPANTKVVTPNKEGSTITSTPTNGLSVDNNGNLVGTPEITDWNDTEEEREVTIPVTVKNGDETKTVDVKVTVQRDTDGDGTPDVTDTDDDGDGIPDNEDQNPKTPDASIADIADQTVVEGKDITPVDVKVNNKPENSTVEVSGLPNGVTYDETSGKITGKPEISDWGKNDDGTDEESREFEVKVEIKDSTGKVVATETFTITVDRDTDKDGNPDKTDLDDDGDGYPDDQENNNQPNPTDPKDPDSKPEGDPQLSADITNPTVTENTPVADNTKVVTPNKEGSTITSETKNGLSVDENGNLVGTPEINDWGKDEETREVTIPVTIKNGDEETTVNVVVTVQRDTDKDGNPDVTDTDDDNDGVSDEDEKNSQPPTDPKDPDSKPGQGDKTTIGGEPKPVNPTDDKQDTGITVTNKDEDTKISATDEDGNKVPVVIEDGKVIVTPGTKVDGPITVVIEDPDLDGGKTTITVPVNGHEAKRDDNNSSSNSGNNGGGSGGGTVPSTNTPDRISGVDRIETAINLSKSNFDKAKTVIIVKADTYADSLTASVLARRLNAPILLTNSDSLPKNVADEIARLGATEVIIVGGETSVTKNVASALNRFDKDIERLGGVDRYETSALVAKRVAGLTKTNKAVVATGETFADALSISPFAAREYYPILLVRKDEIPTTIKKAIDDIDAKEFYISGGTDSVSKKVESSLSKVNARYGGADRYETSKIIADKTMNASTRGYVASGEIFSDALVVGPIAAKDSAPVLLTTKNTLPKVVSNYIDNSKLDRITIVGGEATVSDAVLRQIADLLK